MNVAAFCSRAFLLFLMTTDTDLQQYNTTSVDDPVLFGIGYTPPLTGSVSMTEAAELQAKIAALNRRINQNRRAEPYPTAPPYSPNHSHSTRGAGRWASRGRGGRAGYYQPVQNRVWVAGDTPTPPSAESTPAPRADISESSPAGKTSQNGFYIPQNGIGKRELMSKETYEREQRQKQEYQQARALDPHLKASPSAARPRSQAKHEQSSRRITIEGISFQVSKEGSKLVRVSGEYDLPHHYRAELNSADVSNALQETPKKTTVAGVEFHRTKRGNLIRAPAQPDITRYNRRGPGAPRLYWLNASHRFNASTPKPQCETFTKQGNSSISRPPHLRVVNAVDSSSAASGNTHILSTDGSQVPAPLARNAASPTTPRKSPSARACS